MRLTCIRTYEKNYNFAGTIFVDYENKGDFSDCNTTGLWT